MKARKPLIFIIIILLICTLEVLNLSVLDETFPFVLAEENTQKESETETEKEKAEEEKTTAKESSSKELLTPQEVEITIPVSVEWKNVPEKSIPEELIVTFVPDGVPFMATNVNFRKEMEAGSWSGYISALAGTQTVQVNVGRLEGLEYRVLGDVKKGIVLQYWEEGKIPNDGAKLAEQSIEPEKAPLDVPVETTKVSRPTVSPQAKITIQTEPGESLTPEEYNERMVEAALEARGYKSPNRAFYIAGIVVCAILILIVLAARIYLGKKM